MTTTVFLTTGDGDGVDLRAPAERGSDLVHQSPGYRRKVRFKLRLFVGNCPHCGKGFAPESHIYRSSRRSVTMRCTICGLQWTMTLHQIAKAAERWGLTPETARLITEWADDVGESRGRKRAPASNDDTT